MEDPNNDVININEASMEELAKLPGVGDSLAERIVAARPFEYMEDLEKVNGIGPNNIENLKPYVDLPPAPTDGAAAETTPPEEQPSEQVEEITPDEVVETEEEQIAVEEPTGIEAEVEEITPAAEEAAPVAAEDEIEAVEAEEPIEEAAVEPEEQPPAPAPAGVSHTQLYGIAFLTFLFALVVATALSLGVIAGMNNGNLIFASANQATVLQSEINQLETSLQTLQTDLDSLRGRVDNLEALGDRVEVLETSMDTFQEDLNTTTALVEDLDQRVVGIETDITQVKGSIERFQGFFEGLRELLANIFTPEETEQ